MPILHDRGPGIILSMSFTFEQAHVDYLDTTT